MTTLLPTHLSWRGTSTSTRAPSPGVSALHLPLTPRPRAHAPRGLQLASSAEVWPEEAGLIGKRVVFRKHGGAPEEASVWPSKWQQVGFRARPGRRGSRFRSGGSLLTARPGPELERLAGPGYIPAGRRCSRCRALS